jgi:gluconate 2-dehydrogenase gamma chain
MRVPTRRHFLGTAAVAASGAAVGCGAKGAYRFFTEAEARTLEAMLAHIIPSDDAPGAREAGVIHYIDRQLTKRFRDQQKLYRDGLAALGNFADLAADAQLDALRLVEKDKDRKPFFDAVVTHAMQGFYGNPRHGGNRNFVSWSMLGIPPVPIRGRNREAADAKG